MDNTFILCHDAIQRETLLLTFTFALFLYTKHTVKAHRSIFCLPTSSNPASGLLARTVVTAQRSPPSSRFCFLSTDGSEKSCYAPLDLTLNLLIRCFLGRIWSFRVYSLPRLPFDVLVLYLFIYVPGFFCSWAVTLIILPLWYLQLQHLRCIGYTDAGVVPWCWRACWWARNKSWPLWPLLVPFVRENFLLAAAACRYGCTPRPFRCTTCHTLVLSYYKTWVVTIKGELKWTTHH